METKTMLEILKNMKDDSKFKIQYGDIILCTVEYVNELYITKNMQGEVLHANSDVLDAVTYLNNMEVDINEM